jgi:septum formation protein
MKQPFAGKILLASGSPRRRELMEMLGIRFEVLVKPVDESWPSHLQGEQIAIYLSAKKAEAYSSELREGHLVITADTIVLLGDTVLNKAADSNEAIHMLRQLSGKSHQVITGVCLAMGENKDCFSVTTTVTFKTLPEDEIQYYVERFRPFDKAGAYGIQEWIGLTGIERIEGSYYNVVGLPVKELYERLRSMTGIAP